MRALELELSGSGGGGVLDAVSPSPSGAGAPDDRIQVLNSQLEKTLGQCHEAQTIVQTYDQIVRRLKVRLFQCEKGKKEVA